MRNPDSSLRGKCETMSRDACAADPSLRLVRGWYHDLEWGRQEHWWCEREDGTILDVTSAQFPTGGLAFLYEEYLGVSPCEECGKDVREEDLIEGRCCSERCFGRLVGLW